MPLRFELLWYWIYLTWGRFFKTRSSQGVDKIIPDGLWATRSFAVTTAGNRWMANPSNQRTSPIAQPMRSITTSHQQFEQMHPEKTKQMTIDCNLIMSKSRRYFRIRCYASQAFQTEKNNNNKLELNWICRVHIYIWSILCIWYFFAVCQHPLSVGQTIYIFLGMNRCELISFIHLVPTIKSTPH